MQKIIQKKSQKNDLKKNLYKISILVFLPNKRSLLFLLREISIQPELSSQPRFRIQGGTVSVTDGGGGAAGQKYRENRKTLP